MNNTVAQHIATRSIIDLSKAEERKQGERVEMRWWEQEVTDMNGARNTMDMAA